MSNIDLTQIILTSMGQTMGLSQNTPKIQCTSRRVQPEESIACGYSFSTGNAQKSRFIQNGITGSMVSHNNKEGIISPQETNRTEQHKMNITQTTAHEEQWRLDKSSRIIMINGPNITQQQQHPQAIQEHRIVQNSRFRREQAPASQYTQSLKTFLPYDVVIQQDKYFEQVSAAVINQQHTGNGVYSSQIKLKQSRSHRHDQMRNQFEHRPIETIHQPSQPIATYIQKKSQIRSSHIERQRQINERMRSLQQKLTQIEYYYSEHNIDYAYKEVQEFMQHFGEEFTRHPDYSRYLALIEKIRNQYKEMTTYAAEFNKNTWQPKGKDGGIKLSTCFEQGNVAVLIESELDVPIEIFTTVLNEIDLHKQFIPFVVHSKQQKKIGRNSKIGHVISDFPFLSLREAFFQGAGYDRLQTNNTIFVFTRSIHNRPDLLELYNYHPHPKKDSVMLQYKYLCLEYTPITPKKGYLRLCMNINMQINLMPKFIMEATTKKFGSDMFHNIVKISKKFEGSDWAKAVERNPETFQFFRRVISEYFRKKSMDM